MMFDIQARCELSTSLELREMRTHYDGINFHEVRGVMSEIQEENERREEKQHPWLL